MIEDNLQIDDEEEQIEYEEWQDTFRINNEPLSQENPCLIPVFERLEPVVYEYEVEGPIYVCNLDSDSDTCDELETFTQVIYFCTQNINVFEDDYFCTDLSKIKDLLKPIG